MRIVCTRFFFPALERARAAVWTLFQVSKICGIKFIASEIEFYNQIETACNEKGISKQKYIKDAIAEKLKRDGFLSE